MKPRFSIVILLCLSWIASAVMGGMIAAHWKHSPERNSTIRTQNIEIVDSHGATRIAIGVEQNEPSIRLLSSTQTPLIALTANEVAPSADRAQTIVVPTISLNDGTGQPAIQIFGNHDQRGLIAFDSPRMEGKVMLGHSGISDDGTDTGLWGLQVASELGGMHTHRVIGVTTFNGNDTKLIWPSR